MTRRCASQTSAIRIRTGGEIVFPIDRLTAGVCDYASNESMSDYVARSKVLDK